MTYKFTKGAKEAVEFANDLAIDMGHNYVGTEHLLYGWSKEETGIARKVLEINNVMQLMQSSGKTPKDFFYQFAKTKGVNPDQFLNSLMQE